MRNGPTSINDLPGDIPIFPLTGVLLLPHGQLPLNIFEDRYLAMVEDALAGDRIIGMIQPKAGVDGRALFRTGCAGRITSFEETDDGRYLITLRGVARFHIVNELDPAPGGYRRVTASWTDFARDMDAIRCLDLDRARLKSLLESYFDIQGLSADWSMIEGATDHKLITCLSMICPLDSGEKQALLEASCCRARADLFMTILDMAVRNHDGKCGCDPDRCH